ncbi:PREDICTED: chaperone protein dnaJ 20, chloroplastic-like [Ipomoea nil]|uniref:chaperone protein dnaJ 20, chloroplastic-like n=1 Tax=Ipomoea nil TaxID=35883 RepID=UPI0009019972|nr:PREDICTED: chaperone protein dnaJ 20, chloroplastic-like [Ipomoea nil]
MLCCNSFGLTLSRTDPPRFSSLTCRRVFFPVHPLPRFRIQSKLKDAQPGSLYDLLGIPETGSLPEIKRAYKQLARKYHPDVWPPERVEEYTQRFIRVQHAYQTLSDPKTRALYDTDRAKGLRSSRRRYCRDQPMEDKSEWKSRWQSQLSELKRRSMSKNASWGARMRTQTHQTSS